MWQQQFIETPRAHVAAHQQAVNQVGPRTDPKRDK